MTNHQRKWEPLFYSGVGVAAMLLILIAVGVITSFAKVRVDLTQDRLYTLSEGTRKILGKIDAPLTINFYRTRDQNEMPTDLRNYADRVDDLLAEYRQASRGKIVVKKFDPKPDSDAEDSARLDGVEGQVLGAGGLIGMGEKIYLGLSVISLDQKVALPFLDPRRERLLEYDLTRAIAQVLNPQKPNLGVMSGLPVFGQMMNPMMMRMGQQGQEPWIFVSELKRDFNVREVPMTTEKIDEDLQVLVVVHPSNITEKTQYALDQFVLRGGKLIAFLDPLSVVDSRNAADMQNMLQRAASGGSSLDRLVKAWGLEFDLTKVLADKSYVTTIRRGDRPAPEPTWLSLTGDAINRDEVVTSDIDNLLLPGAGVFTGTPISGLNPTVLLKSSGNSMLVDKMMAQFGGDTTRDFKPEGKEFTIALRLAGKFKTAFPEGQPGGDTKTQDADGNAGDADKAKTESAPGGSLKESTTDGLVILVGDTDLLFDQFTVQVQNFFGQRLIQPFNQNLTLLQNVVEQLMGDSDLIKVRSRAIRSRPFQVVKSIQADAERKYLATIKQLEDEAAETQRKLNELLQNRDAKNQRLILPPEVQKDIASLRAREAETNKELKRVRKQLRSDIDSLEKRLKWINIAGMPIVVAFAGVSLALVKRKKTAAK
ncbi:MAG: GldG family protein [Verrucomicrobia bacterium]|nr:GldG family protein [Verrucomicrobiota bacterium]